uniref:Protein kinase domain-containing protein n=1 Tax=Monopterus albus TaxID=43700 RepID=A0A3Q3J211_MONAL
SELSVSARLAPSQEPQTHSWLVMLSYSGLGIMHTDVKVDNIMLVNHQDQPFKVKLIDFGLALKASEAQVGITMQAPAFRAPEVFLGLPISEAIDMWGLGCVLAFLYFGNFLFPNDPPYKTMNAICQLWRLKTKNEIRFADALEYEDRMEFLHFLKGLLHVDSEQRLTPSQALQHNFITMAHLKGHTQQIPLEQALGDSGEEKLPLTEETSDRPRLLVGGLLPQPVGVSG